jgi:hypothetical protein
MVMTDTTHDGSSATLASRSTPSPARSFLIARWLFLRCLAALYLITFLSLLWQIPGLLGENGISPVKENLRLAQFLPGAERYLIFPTLFWLDGSDAFLYLLCGAGVVISGLVFLGVAPRLLVPLLWLIHLSFFTVGEVLMEFQWDALLLEIGFLALFLTPSGIYPGLGRKEPPSSLVLWLFRLMLFRLVFIAGAVRLHYVLLHGVTAFEVPFASQPVPTLLGWYANTTPLPFRIGLGAVVLASQLLVPFLVFMRRSVRVSAGGILVLQQLALMALGLHFMAGVLTIAVCLTLMDDATWHGFLPLSRKWMRPKPASVKARPAPFRSFAIGVVTLPILTLSAMQLLTPIVPEKHWPAHARLLAALTEPFHIVNAYETFAVAPEHRPEIIIEGSMDGTTWKPYGFRSKTGDTQKPPLWFQPGLARLDTRMRFAAMTSLSENPWVITLMSRLLEGSPEVLTLLDENPFPVAPPRHVRAVRYVYTFNDAKTALQEKTWWHREALGLYAPQLSRPVHYEMARHCPLSEPQRQPALL